MNPQDHAAALIRGLLARPIKLPSGLQVRRLSPLAIRMMQQTGNGIFGAAEEGEQERELTDDAFEDAIAEVLWFHSEDPETILDHFEAGTIQKAVQRFQLAELSAVDLYEFGKDIGEQLAQINAAALEPVPGKTEATMTIPPAATSPTGLSSTSTPSAAGGMKPASTTSPGTSPSPAVSS